MAYEIVMPPLSQTTDSVHLVSWLVSKGDTVEKGTPLCEVETDKVTMEVESYGAGTVLELFAEEDQDVDVGALIAVVGEPGETSAVEESEGARQEPTAPEGAARDTGEPSTAASQAGRAPEGARGRRGSAGGRATPMVARKAEKLGIDLSQVTGSGPQGLITRDDLLAAAAGRGSLAPAEGRTAAGARGAASGAGAVGRGSGVASGAGAAGRGSGVAGGVSTETLPLSDHQVTVAKLMAESRREIPDYTVRVEVDMTRVLLHRGRRSRSDGSRVSMYSYFCYAVSRALERFPRLNGYFHNDALVRYREIGIAVGVAVDEELYAPVVRSPERLAIEQIDSQVADVVSRAKRGALQAEDFLTATFTISNLGGLPVDEFTAVITPGQAGVLAVGRAGKRLMVAADDSIRLRTVCTLNGSFDHRVVNGAQAGAFMAEVKRILEEEIE